ncbi:MULTISPECIES: glycosyltransferase [unclassified Solwaraspora]|uniref:glycosyltransferase n=1 Tax=unclassified Solwaraspora TaxID=2627926 RepID=UPI00259BC7EC|nr:glycosyltransferase [Solwaraspora sp. WMMA2056]WJK42136.1 glycosyltransferase [Solwaraspora sp. WMMA2056]
MIVPWRRGTSAGHLVDDALSALAAADWADRARPPIAWLHWPVDSANPYQSLIYSRFPRHNLVPIRIRRLDQLDRLLPALPDGVTRVLHVHWLYDVTAGCTTTARAEAAVDAFAATLDALRADGVRLVWTVHNLLPHETVHRQTETRLRQVMLAAADVVHLMHDSHLEILQEAFGTSPRQVVVARHPTFVGAYPDWVDRATARSHLGIPLGARLLVTFGQVRPYKGHTDFLDVLDVATRHDPRLRWLVAGKVREETGGPEFMRRAAEHPAVVFHPGFAPDSDVQYFLRAADAAVYPYRSSLNSGALALTAGFGLPAFVSTGTTVGGLMPDAALRRFDLADPDKAAEVITEATGSGWAAADTVRTALRDHLGPLAPAQVSDLLATELRRHLDPTT